MVAMANPSSSNKGPAWHYAWVIVANGALVLFCCLGLARFALGMLLPSMGASLGLSYSDMGLISTANFVGYMAAAALAGYFTQRLGARATIAWGLLLVGGSMLLISRAQGFTAAMCLYSATGFGSGLANIPLMGLVPHWFGKTSRGRAAGLMISGNGMAIICSGILVPWLAGLYGDSGWRAAWLLMGGFSLLIAGLSAALLRNQPRDKGAAPFGGDAPAPKAAGGGGESRPRANPWRAIISLGQIYLIFGATYVVYTTFIVTTLVDERGFSQATAGNFWAVVGGLCIFSGPLFGWFSDRMGRKNGLLLVYVLFTLTYSMAAANLPTGFLLASIGLFGITVFSVPTIMTAAVGDYLGPSQAARAFGYLTLFFGAGQIGGPALAGYLADAWGGFSPAYWLCAGLNLIGIVLVMMLKRNRKQPDSFKPAA
jgi:MFS family permease